MEDAIESMGNSTGCVIASSVMAANVGTWTTPGYGADTTVRRIGFRQEMLDRPLVVGEQATGNSIDVGAKIAPDAQRLLEASSETQEFVRLALSKLPEFIPSAFTASVHRFVDPYDGSSALVVNLKADSLYSEVSRAIDRFCNEFWWEHMDASPINLIFQAES